MRTFSPDLRVRVSFPDARRALLARTVALESEIVALRDAAERVAAQTLRATDDIVPFARSAMDGYALRSRDTRGASYALPLRVPLAAATFAGDAPGALERGRAVPITTGGMLPDGADCVAPFEDVVRDATTIVLDAALAPGDHVFEAGDDARRGDVLVRAGDRITPGRAALLASGGFATIGVRRRPRVAIVSTGNELVPIEARPARGQIRNSNATMLAACAARDGAEIVLIEHARDAEAPLRETLARAIATADLVITSGGASHGERDLVKATLRALGADFAFDEIALRPAKPMAFATCGGRAVAVLPGNPAAAYVAYMALVRGAVRALAGHDRPFPAPVFAALRGRVHRKDRRHYLMFARLEATDRGFDVHPLENQCSSLVRTSAEANALVIAEPGSGAYGVGDRVAVEVLDPAAVF